MVYIQYMQYGVATCKLIPACGDRAVIILDGRHNLDSHHMAAHLYNGVHRRLYPGYQIFKGETFTRSSAISDIIPLDSPDDKYLPYMLRVQAS